MGVVATVAAGRREREYTAAALCEANARVPAQPKKNYSKYVAVMRVFESTLPPTVSDETRASATRQQCLSWYDECVKPMLQRAPPVHLHAVVMAVGWWP